MSNYDNFVSDFPGRCGALLRDFEAAARLRKREVTLLLSVAASAIVIPLERLAGPNRDWRGHPSRDWQKFQEAKNRLDALLDQPFLGSSLWPDSLGSSWSFGELADVSQDPDSWPELQQRKALGPNKKAKTVVWHIRKALAHGNIFTRGGTDIEQIVLLSEVAQGTYRFSFLAVAPVAFRSFLQNWLDFLRELSLPLEVVPDYTESAA